ncbi:MAG: hypothetical protein ACRC8A_01755 [Microcoleaceae cyanobacterium]
MTHHTDQSSSHVKHKIFEQLDSLKREDERLYNILAIDIWALAKTMDEIHPGFWGIFMRNREQALKRFLSQMSQGKTPDSKRPPFLH